MKSDNYLEQIQRKLFGYNRNLFWGKTIFNCIRQGSLPDAHKGSVKGATSKQKRLPKDQKQKTPENGPRGFVFVYLLALINTRQLVITQNNVPITEYIQCMFYFTAAFLIGEVILFSKIFHDVSQPLLAVSPKQEVSIEFGKFMGDGFTIP